MKDESLDPRIDRMMAALYGELSESEQRAFDRLLEDDPALRAEWEELQQSRSVLSAWHVEERVPSFVLLESQVAGASAAANRELARSGRWDRMVETLRSWGAVPAWGLAAVAAAAAFLVADSRVDDKVDREIAARLAAIAPANDGQESPQESPASTPGLAIESLGAADPAASDVLTPVSGSYVTRDEFDTTNETLMQSLVALLNDYGQRQDKETLDLMQAMYERVNRQQLYDYRQLNGKLTDLGHELLVNRSLAEDRIEQLLGPERTGDPAPTTDGEE